MNGKLGSSPPRYLAYRLLAGFLFAFSLSFGGLRASDSAVFQPTGISGDLTAGFYAENEQGPVLVIEKKTSSTTTAFFTWTPIGGIQPLPNSFSSASLRGISRDGRFIWFEQGGARIYDRDAMETTAIGPVVSTEGVQSATHSVHAIQGNHIAGLARFDLPQVSGPAKAVWRYFTQNLVTWETRFMTHETVSPYRPWHILGLKEDGTRILAVEENYIFRFPYTRWVGILDAEQPSTLINLPGGWMAEPSFPFLVAPNAEWVVTHAYGYESAYRSPFSASGAVQTNLSRPVADTRNGFARPIIRAWSLHDGGRTYGSVQGRNDQAGHSGGACVWQPNNARVMLQEALATQYGLALGSWRLTVAFGADTAGLRVAGFGINPEGLTEAWFVTLPTPLPSPEPRPEICVDGSRVSFGLNFASTRIGEERWSGLNVVNNGSANLIVTQMEIIGTDAQMFRVNSPPFPHTIQPTTTFAPSLIFSPTTVGRKQAVLRIHTNDPVRPVYEVTLSGQGPAPIAEFTLKKLSLSPILPEDGSTPFGTATVQRSLTQEFMLRNVGNAPLTIRGLSVGNTGNFRISNAPTGSISPFQPVTFQITFSPQDVAEIETILRLDIDHPDVSAWQTTLVGTGRRPVNFGALTLDNQPLPSGSLLPPFGTVTATDKLRRPVARLGYRDSDPASPVLLDLEIGVEGPNASEFQAGVDPGYGTALLRNNRIYKSGKLTLEVIFAPTSPGLKEAWIVIEDTDQRTVAPLRFPISGEAAPVGRPVFARYPRSFLRPVQPITIGATGSTSYTFRVWRNGQATTVGQVGPSFQVGARHFEGQNGRYRLELVNNSGSTLGPEIWVGSVPSDIIQVRAPIAKPLVLKSRSVGPSLRYQWLFNNAPLSNSSKHSGVTTAALRIASLTEADAGSYSCRITMPAPDGDVTEVEGAQELILFSVPQIVPFSLRPTRVLETHDFEVSSVPVLSDTPTTFRISGLPPGLTGAADGSISGRISPKAKPGIYQVGVSARNPAGQGPSYTTTWVVEAADLSLNGTYHCLFDRSLVPLGGQATITISSSGTFSASVCNAGEWKSLRGIFGGSGPSGLPPRSSYDPPLPSSMTMPENKAGGAALYSISEGELIFFHFAVTNGVVVGGIHSDPSQLHFVGAKRQPAPGHLLNSAQSAATYHLHLAPPDIESLTPDPKKPAGHGFARLTLNSNGTASWKGKLGDGSPFSGSSGGVLLTPESPWIIPLHHTFHSRQGVFQGWLAAIPNVPEGVALGGVMEWHKEVYTPHPKDLSYPDGFRELKVPVSGSLFVPPSRTELLPGWPKPTSPESMDYLLQSHAWPAPKQETWETTVNAQGSHQWQPVSGTPWRFLKGRLDSKTGLYSGTGQRVDGAGTASSPTVVRNATFEGLWIPHFSSVLGFNQLPLTPQDKPTSHLRPPFVTGAMLLSKDAALLPDEIRPVP